MHQELIDTTTLTECQVFDNSTATLLCLQRNVHMQQTTSAALHKDNTEAMDEAKARTFGLLPKITEFRLNVPINRK